MLKICLVSAVSTLFVSPIVWSENATSVESVVSTRTLVRSAITIGLNSSDPKSRSRVIDIIAQRGDRFLEILDAYDSESATMEERRQILHARMNRPDVPVDAAEFRAFEYFKRFNVIMTIVDGHVVYFNSQIPLGEEAIEKIGAFTHLERCSFAAGPMTLEAYSVVQKLPVLKSVTILNNSSRLADASLHCAAMLPNLEELYLPERVTDHGLVAIRGNTRLKKVEIRSNHISDKGIMELRNCTGIENLSIATVLNDKSVDALLELSNLRTLRLESCPITDRGLAKLAVLPNLEEFDLCHCLWIEGDGLEALASVPKLRELVLPASVGSDGLAHLPDFPALEEVTIPCPSLDDGIVDVLINCLKLKRVDIGRGNISDAGVERLYQHFGNREQSSGAAGIYIGPQRQPVTYTK